VVLLNASAVFKAAGKVSSLKGGIAMARESIDSGKAMKKLEELTRFSKRKEREDVS
jgi:anthranilate phosphoribosyltransferase